MPDIQNIQTVRIISCSTEYGKPQWTMTLDPNKGHILTFTLGHQHYAYDTIQNDFYRLFLVTNAFTPEDNLTWWWVTRTLEHSEDELRMFLRELI